MNLQNYFLALFLLFSAALTGCGYEARVPNAEKYLFLSNATVFAVNPEAPPTEGQDPTKNPSLPPGATPNNPPSVIPPWQPIPPIGSLPPGSTPPGSTPPGSQPPGSPGIPGVDIPKCKVNPENPGLPPVCEAPKNPPPGRIDNPTKNECSDNVTGRVGFNLKSLTSVKLVVFDENDQKICDFVDPDVRTHLINERRLLVENIDSKCPGLKAGQTYSLVATSPDVNPTSANTDQNLFTKDVFFIVQKDAASGKSIVHRVASHFSCDHDLSQIQILFDNNPKHNGSVVTNPDLCDYSHSPLVIHMASDINHPRMIDLTAPLSGISFDIMGRNSNPTAFAKKLISWFLGESVDEHYFIALPNANGRIEGIDQLFGNNTYGPDGRFAANGFDALAKYDGRYADGTYDPTRRDGYIDARDPIYNRLVLWSDRNLNGVADPGETSSLAQMGVEFIDLQYDRRFIERDTYSNETVYKSIAKTGSGLRLVYDLWFRAL